MNYSANKPYCEIDSANYLKGCKMRVARLTSLALASWLVLSSCRMYSPDPEQSYAFATSWDDTFVSVSAIDIDRDGADELVFDYGEQIDVMDAKRSEMIASFSKTYAQQANVVPLATGTLDSLAFLFIFTNRDSVRADLWLTNRGGRKTDVRKNYFIFRGEDRDGDGVFHQTFVPLGVTQDSLRRSLTLFSLNNAKDLAKRGVMAVDLKSGKIEWEYLFGPQLTNFIQEDLDGDGREELAIGTYAPDNGAENNGTRDDSSYVFVLNSDGSLRWKKTIGPFFTGARIEICDLEGDGQKDVLVYRHSLGGAGYPQDEIMLLHPADGHVIKSKRIGQWFTAAPYSAPRFCKDMDGNGSAEIVIGNTDGFVRTFDGELNAVKNSERFNSAVTVVGVDDYDGDKIMEVACLTADNYLTILSHDLKKLKQHKLPAYSDLNIVRASRKPFFLISSGEPAPPEGERQFALLELQKLPLPLQAVRQEKLFWQWTLAVALIAALLIYSRNLFYGAHGERMIFSFLQRAGLHNQVLALRRNGKIVGIGSGWCELFGAAANNAVGKNFRKIFLDQRQRAVVNALAAIIGNKEFEQTIDLPLENEKSITLRLSSYYVPFIQIHFVHLFDLSEQEHLSHVKSWAPMAQRLAHGIKNPLTTVKLNAEELRDLIKTKFGVNSAEVEAYFEAVISQVNRLTKMSDGFMRFVKFERPDLQPADLNALVKEHYPQWLPEKTEGIAVEFQPAENLPPALVDREHFIFALKTVFYNALESLEAHGRIVISTSPVQLFSADREKGATNDFIELQIRDTGRGIPREYLPKVGEPYFTLKRDGTGMGLSLVKKIMEDHEGKFEIDSEEGIGTVVTLRFRATKMPFDK